MRRSGIRFDARPAADAERLCALAQVSFTPRPGLSEDCALAEARRHDGILAVFDGCGGLGSRRYPSRENHSGAYLAARLACSAALDWFRAQPDLRQRLASAARWGDGLGEQIAGQLRRWHEEELSGERSRLSGSMVRALPTTVCAALMDFSSPRYLDLSVLWAGDSRVYTLTRDGLRQHTQDDLQGSPDSLENLYCDAPLSNLACADRTFSLRHRHIRVEYPAAVIAATDGAFNGHPSPMHFECFLLDALMECDSVDHWAGRMEGALAGIASDDASMAIAVLGVQFEELKAQLTPRHRWMKAQYIDRLGDGAPALPDLRKLWREYERSYMEGRNPIGP